MFKKGFGNWTQYRGDGVREVDFHRSEFGARQIPYWEAMSAVYDEALANLKRAHEDGVARVLFRHGASTSGRGKETSRSVIRRLMRSKDATPYIIRKDCIKHETVFVAAIRPRKEQGK